MRQTIAAAVAVLALAACPSVEQGATGPQGPEGQQGPAGYSALASGTRIKARVGTTPDGAKLFIGWHDAELGEACSFRTAADGKTRCLPDVYDSTASSSPVAPGSRYFSDPGCTTEVVPATTCIAVGACAVPGTTVFAAGKVASPKGSELLYGVYEVSDLVKGLEMYESNEYGCMSRGSVSYLEVEQELDPAAFQGIEETIE